MSAATVRAGAVCIAFVALVAGCGGGGSSGGSAPPPIPRGTPTPSPIPTPTQPPGGPTPTPPANNHLLSHVVIIVQENRSFDNLFMGFPGADTVTQGLTHDGKVVKLQPVGFEAQGNLGHQRIHFLTEWNGGKMNGFDNETLIGNVPPNFAYSYVPQKETVPYWLMAKRFTLGDRMFQSNSSDSFAAHQYLIAGQSADVVDSPNGVPWGCDAPPGTTTGVGLPGGNTEPGPFPCFNYDTLATRLNAAHIYWRFYSPSIDQAGGALWSAFDASSPIRHSFYWQSNVISPETNVLNDISLGRLPAVSWVIPSFGNSDHPASGSMSGPAWVGSIVNAIGASSYWNSTAIFVVWDDWGGWYDHVPPPVINGDYVGPGFRVGFLAISPWAKHGYVSHVVYGYGSILNFAEWVFNLPSLGVTDATSNALFDCFDFKQKPPKFVPLALRRSARDFMNAPPDHRPPDDD